MKSCTIAATPLLNSTTACYRAFQPLWVHSSGQDQSQHGGLKGFRYAAKKILSCLQNTVTVSAWVLGCFVWGLNSGRSNLKLGLTLLSLKPLQSAAHSSAVRGPAGTEAWRYGRQVGVEGKLGEMRAATARTHALAKMYWHGSKSMMGFSDRISAFPTLGWKGCHIRDKKHSTSTHTSSVFSV